MASKAELERQKRHKQFEDIFNSVAKKGVDPFMIGYDHDESLTLKEKAIETVGNVKKKLDHTLVHRPPEKISEFDREHNMSTKGRRDKASPFNPSTWFSGKTVTETQYVAPNRQAYESFIRSNLVFRLKNIYEERGADRLDVDQYLSQASDGEVEARARQEGIVLYGDGNKVTFS